MKFAALFGSEVRRLCARRALRGSIALGLAIVAIVVVVNAINSTGTGFDAHTMRLSKLWLERPGGVHGDMALAMSIFVFILVVGLAATAIGGEYRAGTVGTLLTWEPRRIRVALARVSAVVLVTVAMYLLVIGVFVGGWYVGASWRGSTAGLGPDFWSNLAAVIARCALGAGLLATITSGLVLITRTTVGGLIAWIGYLIAIEGVLAGRNRSLEPSLFLTNFSAFLTGEDVAFSGRETFGPGGRVVQSYVAQPGTGLIRCVVIAVVLAGLGTLAFRRRDVA